MKKLCYCWKKLHRRARTKHEILNIKELLNRTINPIRSDAVTAVKKALRLLRSEKNEAKNQLIAWMKRVATENEDRYNSYFTASHRKQLSM